MILFRQSELDALAGARFERRLVELLCEEDPAAADTLGTQAGMRMLREQCGKARRYGLHGELDVARYVITAWLLGPDFDQRFPAMAEVLNASALAPAQKAEAIQRVALATLQGLAEGAG